MADHGVDLTELASDLMETADLPGFHVSKPSMVKLENLEQPRYESTFTIQNNEQTPGPVKLSLTYQNGDDYLGQYMSETRPSLLTMLVGANQSLQVVIESSNPVQHITVEPYLSLNRMNLLLDLPESDQLQAEVLVGDDKPYIKSITKLESFKDVNDSSITIDDLDPCFSIVELGGSSTPNNLFFQFFRRLVGTKDVPMDHGLPKYSLFNFYEQKGWHRWTDPTAYGTYRRTFTIARLGTGNAFAKFHATLPAAGKWELEYYLPKGHFSEEVSALGSSSSQTMGIRIGTFHLEIRNGSTTTSKTLDAPNSTPGWQSIGTFDLPAEEVDVLVSNKTDSLYVSVFADAIRWTPIETLD